MPLRFDWRRTIAGLDPALPAALAHAIAWCDHHADLAQPSRSLRPASLKPRILALTREEAVCEVLNARARELRVKSPTQAGSVEEMPHLGGGRLLSYFPDAELSDGAAEQETDGLFDKNNAPPWATWVAFLSDSGNRDLSYRAMLVCYVPEELVELAGRGIDVNPEGCIAWLADTETEVAQRLRRAGYAF